MSRSAVERNTCPVQSAELPLCRGRFLINFTNGTCSSAELSGTPSDIQSLHKIHFNFHFRSNCQADLKQLGRAKLCAGGSKKRAMRLMSQQRNDFVDVAFRLMGVLTLSLRTL